MQTIPSIQPPTYPLRPVNGGPLDKALPKSGRWFYEPKVNGWRALVHMPTGRMFNRKGERLSIEMEFATVLQHCKDTFSKMEMAAPHLLEFIEWLDCEAFERRHPLGKGSLILLDLPKMPGNYENRQVMIGELVNQGIVQSWPQEQFGPPDNSLLHFAYTYQTIADQKVARPDDDITPEAAWQRLQAANKAYGCELFEGLVAKKASSCYPHQLRSPDVEFPFWMKHRWTF